MKKQLYLLTFFAAIAASNFVCAVYYDSPYDSPFDKALNERRFKDLYDLLKENPNFQGGDDKRFVDDVVSFTEFPSLKEKNFKEKIKCLHLLKERGGSINLETLEKIKRYREDDCDKSENYYDENNCKQTKQLLEFLNNSKFWNQEKSNQNIS